MRLIAIILISGCLIGFLLHIIIKIDLSIFTKVLSSFLNYRHKSVTEKDTENNTEADQDTEASAD